MSESRVLVSQAPLRRQYKAEPAAAMVTDHAVTTGQPPQDPFHNQVMPLPRTNVVVPVSIHSALGGPYDAPTSGDILCAALACCQDGTTRVVADLLGIAIESISVEVKGDVDVRGTLAVDPSVPVGFQAMRCTVRLRVTPGPSARLLDKLREQSERSCVIVQTLQHPPKVDVAYEIEVG